MSRWTSSDPYEVLGLPAGSSLPEVKAAYRRLAKRLHHDSNPDPRAEAAFDAVTNAYNKICQRLGKPRNNGGPLLASTYDTANEPVTELRSLGNGVEAQVLATARLRSYYRQLPTVVAAAQDLRQGNIAALRPCIVELFRRSTFSDDEEGARALVHNTARAIAGDAELFAAMRNVGMTAKAFLLLAEAIICEAAVQQHEGEMILDGQFFSPVVQSRLALLVRRAEIVIRQLLEQDAMKASGSTSTRRAGTGSAPKATPTTSGFVVLD